MLPSCLDLLVLRKEGIRESTRDAHLEMGDGDACTLHSQEGKLIACVFHVNPSITHATSKCTRPQALDFAPSFKITHAWVSQDLLVRQECHVGPAKSIRPACCVRPPYGRAM